MQALKVHNKYTDDNDILHFWESHNSLHLKIKSIIVVFSLIAHETETENRKIPWVFPEWIFQ